MNLLQQQMATALSARELGQIPVSIATSRALEGAFGILEDHVDHNPIINRVDVLYVNLRTLIRNITGAVDKEINEQVLSDDILPVLANELEIIQAAVKQVSKGKVEVVPYVCSYESLKRRFPHAMVKPTTTPKQIFSFTREVNTLADFEQQRLTTLPVKHFDIEFDKDDRKALLLTNYAFDLLQRYKFQVLSLLESHTGAVKPPALWHTKLTNGKELPRIPFDRMTVQMFGDNSNLFSPFPIAYRRKMVMIAEKNNWTPLTTKALILDSVKKEHDPVLELAVMQLYGGNR